MFPKLKNDHENHKKLGNLYTYITRRKSFNLSHRVHFRKLNKNTLRLDRRIVTIQIDIMPIYHYLQNQEKVVVQSRENGQKPQFRQFFDDFEVKYLKIAVFFVKNRFYLN